MDLIGFFYGFGILQGLILAVVLLAARSGHRLANAIMVALLVVIVVYVLHQWLVRIEFWTDRPALAFTIFPLKYTWGPLLYLYAFSLTGGQLRYRQGLHFAPALLIFLTANLSFWQLSGLQQSALISNLQYFRNDPAQLELDWESIPRLWHLEADFHFNPLLFVLHFACYCAMLLVLIRDHGRRLRQHFSSLEQMNLRWLRVLTIACLLYLVVYLVVFLAPLLLYESFDRFAPVANASGMVLVLLIYVIAFSALFQPSLISGVLQARHSELHFDRAPSHDSSTEAEPGPESTGTASTKGSEPRETGGATGRGGKYQHSRLSMEDAQRYKIRLMEVMHEEELYLDSELTLHDLARATGLSAHQISQVINGQMSQNFFTFVNNYRIQTACSLLSDPETSGMPIVELAFEVGFKSKSSFYDAFKRATNMTPTQFKKRAAEGASEPGA